MTDRADHRIRFTIGLEDMVDGNRLRTRDTVSSAAVVFIIVGIAVAAVIDTVGGLIVVGLGALALLVWRFPVIDRWLISRRGAPVIGTECEVWFDDAGVAYRQTGRDGHFDWKAIDRIVEDDRSVILMQGRVALLGIPKRAFASQVQTDAFLGVIRTASNIR